MSVWCPAACDRSTVWEHQQLPAIFFDIHLLQYMVRTKGPGEVIDVAVHMNTIRLTERWQPYMHAWLLAGTLDSKATTAETNFHVLL